MGGRTKWNFVIIVFVSICLMATQLELSAFAQEATATSAQEGDAAGSAAPTKAPASFELAAAQTPAAPAAQATPAQTPTNPAPAPAPAPTRHTWRWILIGVAATAVIVGTIILLHNPKPEPVITVGAPTIGNPN